MSTYNPFLQLSEQLGYVQCSFCTTILLVSVPCSSLLKVVTVRCGHCTSLLSVDMVTAPFVPLQFYASLEDDEPNIYQEKKKACRDVLPKARDEEHEEGEEEKEEEQKEEEEEEEKEATPVTTIFVNKPPEKRQRAPSAYNRFIRDEIQRIKVREPNITHKEAFSAAAKNQKGDGESCSLGEGKKERVDEVDGRNRGRKVSRQSIWAKTPFE